MYAAFAKQEKERVTGEQKKHVPAGVGAPKPLGNAALAPAPIAQVNKRFDDIDSDIEDEEDTSEKARNRILSNTPSKPQVDDLNAVDDGEMRYVPPPRSTSSGGPSGGKVGISFTPRIFPTPMRASQTAKEEDWIAKNRKHLKKHGVFSKNLKGAGDITEEDPAWLKAKGDDFYRNGDCRSAINAYSAAIDIDEAMIPCYSNRSACYFKLGLDGDCKDDCTAALNLLEEQRTDVDLDNAAELLSINTMSVKLLLRRGISHCRLGLLAEALQDYMHGNGILSLHPDINLPGITVKQVEQDARQLEKIVNADEKKKEADVCFGQRNLTRAAALYSEVLDTIPEHVGCLSNRSACKIASGDLEGCIQDCNVAVHYLQSEQLKLGESGSIMSPVSDSSLSMLYAVIPPPQSEKRKTWLLKTVVRRGAVLAQLGNFDAAIRDYGLALSLDPGNADLQTDLQNLVNTRSKRAQHGIEGPLQTDPPVQ